MRASITIYILTSVGTGLVASWLIFVVFGLIDHFITNEINIHKKDNKYLVYIYSFLGRIKFSRVVILIIFISFVYHFFIW